MPHVIRKDKQTGSEISIYYEVVGTGAEAIVLHHGNGNCLQDWYTLGYVEALKPDFTLVMLDSRGYGQSSKPHAPKEYSLKSRVEDTIAVLDDAGIATAHCLGASIGASMCFLLAKYHPHRFKSYLFATPYFQLFDTTIRQALALGIASYVAALETLIGGRITNEAIRQTFLANDAKALLASNSAEWYNYQDYIESINKPSLIYVGANEATVPDLMELAQALKDTSGRKSDIHIFPDSDHAKVYWDGSGVAPIIKRFIESTLS